MKQHITIEQLKELSEKGKEKLSKWTDSRGDAEYIGEATCSECGKSGLLTIAQMIEFLPEARVESVFDCYRKKDDLCDALWEPVKEILNDNHQ